MTKTVARDGRVVAVVVATPVLALLSLLALPVADRRWEHHPSHFWLVLGSAVAAGAVALAVGATARRRADARLFLVGLAFTSAAEFFVLHALATPGALLDHANAGFVAAMPVGLLIASLFAVWSSTDMDRDRARAIMRWSRSLQVVTVGVAVVWAACSLGRFAPLDRPLVGETATAWLWSIAAPGLVAYGAAGWWCFRLHRTRGSGIALALGACWVLLAEADLAIAVARAWRLSWWEWHVLVLVAFAGVALVARRLPESEPFADLYLADTAAGTREVSVLFADLVAFSTFSESRSPDEVQRLVNTYFDAVVPAVTASGGRVDRYIGDAVMVTWNVAAEQPDHPQLAAGGALAFQAAAGRVAADHPDWPVFRVGVNSGSARTGLIGGGSVREFSVLGDTVNVAARLEGIAPPGEVAISGSTLRRIRGARVRSLGDVLVKGRREPVEVWLLESLGD